MGGPDVLEHDVPATAALSDLNLGATGAPRYPPHDLSLVFRLVREWYVRDGLEDDLAVGVDRGWEGLGRAVDRDGRGAQGA